MKLGNLIDNQIESVSKMSFVSKSDKPLLKIEVMNLFLKQFKIILGR